MPIKKRAKKSPKKAGTVRSNMSITYRMVMAAKLDGNLFMEVKADTTAKWQAFTAVIIVSLVAGIGGVIGGLIWSDAGISLLWGFFIGIALSITGWLLLTLVVWFMGTGLFKTEQTETDYGQLLRTLGFATTPSILGFFVFIPFLGQLLLMIGFIWRLVASVVAVKQVMGLSIWIAIGICILGLIPHWLLSGLVNWLGL